LTEEEMQSHPGEHVEAIHIRLGALSGVVKEALLAAYEIAAYQTPFASSRLVFEDVPVVIYCAQCGGERPVQSIQRLCCAECDTPAAEIVRGRDLQLAALELEE